MRKRPRFWSDQRKAAWTEGSQAAGWHGSPPCKGSAGKRRDASLGWDGVQYGLGMARDFYAAPLLREMALGVDQKRAAHDPQVGLAVEHLLVDHVEGLAPGFVGVGDERERQLLLGGEIGMTAHAVARHADDDGVARGEFGVQVAEVLRLAGAGGGAVLGVEINNYPFALKAPVSG